MSRGPTLSLALVLLAACDPGVAPLRVDAGAPTDSAARVPADCADEAVVREWVLTPRCGSADCHGGDDPAAGLDLERPGVTDRVIASRSIHDDCADRPIVVPGLAPASFLMDKVLAQEGACGDPMPREGDLPLEERRCLVEWIGAMR